MRIVQMRTLACAFVAALPLHSNGQTEVFWRGTDQELEFGVNSNLGQSPSVLESGYNGAWVVFGSPQFYGMGQTFTVPSVRTLESVQLRVGEMNDQPVTGHFEVAVYLFDPKTETPSLKLAAVSANAQDYYHYPILDAPVSSFDLSSFHVSLDPSETYALAVTQGADYVGGALSLQAATDVYPGGMAYLLSVVPEPGSMALLAAGAILLLAQKRWSRVPRAPEAHREHRQEGRH